MNKNETVLLDLIKKSLFDVEVAFPEDTDWDEVQKEATAQTVVALVASAVPENESAKWKKPAAQSTSHFLRVLYEQTNLVNLFQDNNIPFVILKGMAAAMYYPNPKLRTMGDIDFIVDPEHYNKAAELFEKNGYITDDNKESRHWSFQKGGVTFELHHRYSHEEFDVEPIVIRGIKNSVTRSLNGCIFPTLPDYENGFIILEHLYHHLHTAIGIRQLIDWAMFANRVLTDENYKEHFLPIIESVGLVTFCVTITKMCKMYLGLPDTFTWCDNADTKTADEFMQLFMQNGNFGIKEFYNNNSKPMKGLVISIKRNGFFKTLQELGTSNFKICKRNRFFHWFAWLFQLFRCARKGFAALLQGENLIKDARDGKEKADFYKRLGI